MINALIRTGFTIALATSATILTVVGSAAPVQAAEATRTAVIDIRGIDLASPSGRDRVEAEVRRAAARVCDNGDARSLRGIQASRACTAAAIAAATQRVETLASAAHDARTATADADLPTAMVRR